MNFQQLIKQDEVQPSRYFAFKVESFSNLIYSIQKALWQDSQYRSIVQEWGKAGHPGQEKTLKPFKPLESLQPIHLNSLNRLGPYLGAQELTIQGRWLMSQPQIITPPIGVVAILAWTQFMAPFGPNPMRSKGAKGQFISPQGQVAPKPQVDTIQPMAKTTLGPEIGQEPQVATIQPMASGNHQRPPAHLQARILPSFRGSFSFLNAPRTQGSRSGAYMV
ncbi:hypothetical protein O181_030071 [Austropuccinia psidii MF-1]|uniref:Uncharacterized protein n=1 Tax=Austropuccinia psidii MF-1 TaxID=1389203 RepID=A0A9Q3CXR2_9BASI|nr:hypothetical protein [Austropuccinia psidii MF-1]